MTIDHQNHTLTTAARCLLKTGELGSRMSRDIAEVSGDGYLAGNAPAAVLTCLWLEKSMRPRDVAKVIGLTTGGTTKVLDHLEDSGLVVRDADAIDDGRGVAVTLTAKGQGVTERILSTVGPSLAQLASELAMLLDD